MFAGLTNPGAIGFLNTLIQVLYHIPGFRRRIYAAPTSQVKDKEKSILFQLQKLFYKLQTTTDSSTDVFGLTRAFGWTQSDLKNQQQDIFEFYNIFLERLDQEAARLGAPETPSALFDAELKNYIKCINVDYERSRNEVTKCTFKRIIFEIRFSLSTARRSLPSSSFAFSSRLH